VLKLVVDVTVVIPTISRREQMLQRALGSVYAQTVQVANTVVQSDENRRGAAVNRDLGLDQSDSEWTAFLDDDDELYPDHIKSLLAHAERTGADLVFPWFDVIGGTDPFPFFEGLPWSNDNVHQVPITFLVKTEAAKAVGGFSGGWNDTGALDEHGHRMGEDLHFIWKMVNAGYKIEHLNKRTWAWHHHGANTSGLPDRW
jgi:glycosyltransferase involved in cell wall biosynthesis